MAGKQKIIELPFFPPPNLCQPLEVKMMLFLQAKFLAISNDKN
jgi:hypothetical protein